MSRRIAGGRRALSYDRGQTVAPFASRLIHANYTDRGIAIATGVSGWEDVVGNRDFVQADTTKQPVYGLFTTKPAIAMDDVNDFMVSPTLALSAYTSITIAWSFAKSAGTGMVFELSPDINSNPGGFYCYDASGTTITLTFRNVASNAAKSIGGMTAGNVYRCIAVLNASAAATTWSPTYLNGVSQGTGGTSDRGLKNDVMYIGMRGGTSEPSGTKFGDFLIYGDALSADEIAIVDAFLASRCT